jgi:hypothetical protein
MAFGFCMLAPVAMREPWEVHRAALRKQGRGVACIGAFLALNIALSNISLMDISLTLNQIIRWVRRGAGPWAARPLLQLCGGASKRPLPARLRCPACAACCGG